MNTNTEKNIDMELPYTVMSRQAAEFWWNKTAEIMGKPPVVIPPEIAYYKLYSSCGYEKSKKIPVTWSEVMEKRKKTNDFRLLCKRSVHEFEKPAFLIVFYCPAWFFMRWWIYVKTVNGEYPVNFKTNNARELERQCFNIFPLGVIGEFNYDAWCEEFYKRYKVPPLNFKGQKIAFAKVRVRIRSGKVVELRRYEAEKN